jgi:hypothetical protein
MHFPHEGFAVAAKLILLLRTNKCLQRFHTAGVIRYTGGQIPKSADVLPPISDMLLQRRKATRRAMNRHCYFERLRLQLLSWIYAEH